MLRSPHAGPWLGILLAAASASCGEQDTQFNVKSAPGFSPGRTTVSLFGVFRDGRMSPESWGELGPTVSAALGQPSCEAAYGERLSRAHPELFAAVDEDTQANGITEDLLEKFASMAGGELIMTLSIHDRGKRATMAPESIAPPMAGAMRQPSRGGGGASGMHGSGHRHGQGKTTMEDGGVEIAASLFSVRQHRSMARLAMQTTAPNLEEAMRRFMEKLGALIPGSTCRGWSLGDP